MFVEAASKGGTQKGKLEIRRKASASIARKRTQVNGKAVTGTWLTRWAKIYWLAAVSQLLPKVLDTGVRKADEVSVSWNVQWKETLIR